MDYNKACEILGLNHEHLCKDVKKMYFKQALRWHPDKYEGDDNKFKEIKEAYDFLSKERMKEKEYGEVEVNYTEILKQFIKEFSPDSKWEDIFLETSFSEFTKKSVEVGQKISFKIFKSLSVERALEVYEMVNKWDFVFNIDEELLNMMKKDLHEKMNSNNIVVINPSIDDMLNDNIYKLEIGSEDIIYIPLWHRKIYDKLTTDNPIMIMIIPPELEGVKERIFIRSNNDIYVKIDVPVLELFERGHLEFKIGEKHFMINSEQLTLTKEVQMVVLKNRGILRINKNDIYSSKKRGHIVVEITLV